MDKFLLNMNMIQVLACLIILAILTIFFRRSRNKRLYQLLEQFPSYKTYPLIGNAYQLWGSLEGLLERIEKVLQPYDRLVYWLGPFPCIILKKYDDIATVLNQCQDRDTFEILDKWVGVAIVNARYEEWKKSRRIVAPGFTSDMLSKYVDVFNRNASNLVQNLRPVANTGEQIDVLDWMMSVNLDTVVENVMGVAIRNCGKQGEDFCNAMHEAFKHGVRHFQWPWLLFHCVDKIYLKLTGKFKFINHLQNLPTEILRKKLKNCDNLQVNHNDQVNVDSSKTIIDLLIKNYLKEGGISEIRMRDELLHLIVAGEETSALTMSFLMLMLAMNQDVQQKAYEEIVQLMADNDTYSESHLTNDLQYLEQCVRETLRMFAPVTATSRRTQKEILLKDNTTVPKNTIVISLIHLVNYDPDLYRDPEKWDPEHFSKEAVKQRPKTSQQFFGYGARSCIGAKYAMMSIKAQIANILRNFHLSTDVKVFTKQHLKMDLSIRSKIGYPIRLTSRQESKLK